MKSSILIIDDSLTVRQQVAAILIAVGYEVIQACDGLAGLEAVRANPGVAMILCDVNMPHMGGLEFLEKFKGENIRQTPVVMLTTEGSPDLLVRAKRSGARGWIVKPFRPDLLSDAVRRMVGAPAGSSAGNSGS